jgi:peptidyl-prolyl cis-trans isomerase A (cyclophilin A)
MPIFFKNLSILFSRMVAAALCLTVGFASAEPKPDMAPKATKAPAAKAAPVVVFKTSLGELHIELFNDTAPVSAQNFLQYVDSGFYNGVIFHRVVPGFVVQGGGFDQEYQRKNTQPPIINESDNGEKNLRGTLSMARTGDPNSATSQFFINLLDNQQLDGARGQPGYAVFGRVIEGMAVVDAMVEKPQGKHTGAFVNAPNEPIVIERAYRKISETKTQKPKN